MIGRDSRVSGERFFNLGLQNQATRTSRHDLMPGMSAVNRVEHRIFSYLMNCSVDREALLFVTSQLPGQASLSPMLSEHRSTEQSPGGYRVHVA